MSGQILIVEDDRSIRELLETVLKNEGYRVAAAPDGQAALEALAIVRYDLVLSNIMMPRVDGRELASAMQADVNLKGIPVILMSAAGPTLVPGVPHAAFIPKPFDLEHMLTVVEDVLTTAAD